MGNAACLTITQSKTVVCRATLVLIYILHQLRSRTVVTQKYLHEDKSLANLSTLLYFGRLLFQSYCVLACVNYDSRLFPMLKWAQNIIGTLHLSWLVTIHMAVLLVAL
jgi:hypothetical protein